MKQKKSRKPKRKPTQSKKEIFPFIYAGESPHRSQGEYLPPPVIFGQEVIEGAPFTLADAPLLQLP